MSKIGKITKSSLSKYKRIIDIWFTNGFNGREAYKSYFPKSKDTTATCNFSKIKEIPEIQEYINSKREKAAEKIETTHEGILQELKRWIEYDITETIGLTPEELKALPIYMKRLITKYNYREKIVKFKDGTTKEKSTFIDVTFVSKEKAIEMINKHIGFYEEDNKQKAITADLSMYSYEQLKELAGDS